jgi:hypothetical protein
LGPAVPARIALAEETVADPLAAFPVGVAPPMPPASAARPPAPATSAAAPVGAAAEVARAVEVAVVAAAVDNYAPHPDCQIHSLVLRRLTMTPKLLLLAPLTLLLSACTGPQSFPTADSAVDNLVSALRTGDTERIHKILGPEADDLLDSGDAVADHNKLHEFLAAYDQKHSLQPTTDGSVNVVIGDKDWPMPIPVVKNDFTGSWSFDTKAGKEEILNRRIGRNELDSIEVCLAIVDAQRDYAKINPEHLSAPTVYARQFISDEGKKNGLFWPTDEGEPLSPLGPLAASASEEGYVYTAGHPRPYHGYYYHMLTAQGTSAPGGPINYIDNGILSKGFAVIAWPAEYGNSGIATFIVNHQGIIYARDLGPDTAKIASGITSFDPTAEWTPVKDAPTVLSKQ